MSTDMPWSATVETHLLITWPRVSPAASSTWRNVLVRLKWALLAPTRTLTLKLTPGYLLLKLGSHLILLRSLNPELLPLIIGI